MPGQRRNGVPGRPLVFGEVLLDHFAEGGAVLGGAPFNVAWHLQGLGFAPLLVTRIGSDDPGDRVLAEMTAWGMDTGGVQRDAFHPTGTVRVDTSGDEPRFDILPRQAYDFIGKEEALQAVEGERFSLVYQGTLAIREASSRAALEGLQDRLKRPVFIDVNLRPPWWERSRTLDFLRAARWGKMNAEELALLTGRKAGAGGIAGGLAERAAALGRQARLDMVIVTLGARGAFLVQETRAFQLPAAPAPRVVDTVGAGDAFSALCMAGISLGWDPVKTLARALEFSARMVAQRGAILKDPALYESYRGRWEM